MDIEHPYCLMKLGNCLDIHITIGIRILSGKDPGILEKDIHMYKGVGVDFADFISLFLNTT